jgi:predicted Zn-dependent protease
MKLASVLLLAVTLAACTTSPLGRRQLKLFPESEMARMGLASFASIKKQVPQSSDVRTIDYVGCVATAVLAAVPGTMPSQWEVVVFEDKTANAFALPGGRIGVHTGLLAVATSQDQLAAVIGHEVAHVIAGHANERISQASLTQAGLTIAQVAAGPPSASQRQIFGLLGMGAQLGILLPYSRQHETEADLVGLDYMARAGFDPRESVALWRNMSRAGGGQQPPEFMSTHPSHATRTQGLETRMPSAMRLYEAARQAGRRPNCGR